MITVLYKEKNLFKTKHFQNKASLKLKNLVITLIKYTPEKYN